ncbi:MAG: serine hydrolase [Gemmatimonadetes bacterium]|nr:beta-lactamase family protein [Gemmatimonadota bacterium]NNF14595.1 serine hydrolase [Gemmatimonadota bacterium]
MSGCQDDPFTLDSNVPTFDVDAFEAGVVERMGDQPVGWAYVINQGGNLARSGAFGNARSAADGQVAMTVNKPINMASITKLLTAIAVMQLLEARNLDVDDEIDPWLPPGWDRGPGVDELTFRDLMSHRSGLNSVNSDFTNTLCYDCLRGVIEEGVTQSTDYTYRNANFALFRIVIPMMWAGLPGAPSVVVPSESTTNAVYMDYMDEHVFDAIGVTTASLEPEDRSTATFYYAVGDEAAGNNGTAYGDWTAIAGGGGYYMSTVDLARILAFYEHSTSLVSEDDRAAMKSCLCGFDSRFVSMEPWGDYFHKNGSISNGAGQGVLTEAVVFPNDVEIAVATNTQGLVFTNGDSFRQMLYRAYNSAWTQD